MAYVTKICVWKVLEAEDSRHHADRLNFSQDLSPWLKDGYMCMSLVSLPPQARTPLLLDKDLMFINSFNSIYLFNSDVVGAGEMAQRVKVFTMRPDN